MNDKRKYLRLLEDVKRARPVIPGRDELLGLCEKIRISAAEPSVEYGHHWCVYAHPVRMGTETHGPPRAQLGQEAKISADILIHIHPTDPDADYSALGIRIVLVTTDGTRDILSSGALDADGQTWFKDVGEGLYSIFFDRRTVHERGEKSEAAASRRFAAAPDDEKWIIRHKTPLASAVLQPSEDGHAELTVYADVSLEGKIVVFAIGAERCELKLERKGKECKASHDFGAQFRTLPRHTETFVIKEP